MIKIFTTDKNGKISLSAKELKELLDESYWEGYRSNSKSWTYTSPSVWSPYTTTTASDGSVTIGSSYSTTTTSATVDANTVSRSNITNNRDNITLTCAG